MPSSKEHAATLQPHGAVRRDSIEAPESLIRQGILKLLAIKDSDIRILTLEQCRNAVDQGLHAGGAFSATVPLVTLFYGGFITPDVEDPTRAGQDMFVLSKGHAVAALASIYAELGYFDRKVLVHSRSYESILNGHPGPILPGIQIATGPMGQGFAVAQGSAIAGRRSPRFKFLRGARRWRTAGRPDLGDRDVRGLQKARQPVHPGGSQSRAARCLLAHGV